MWIYCVIGYIVSVVYSLLDLFYAIVVNRNNSGLTNVYIRVSTTIYRGIIYVFFTTIVNLKYNLPF